MRLAASIAFLVLAVGCGSAPQKPPATVAAPTAPESKIETQSEVETPDPFKKELAADIDQIVQRICVQQDKFADEVSWNEILSSAGVETSSFWLSYTGRTRGQTGDVELGRREQASLAIGLKDAVLAVCNAERTVLSKTPREKLNAAAMQYLDSIVPRPEGLTPSAARARRAAIDTELKELNTQRTEAIAELSNKKPILQAELLAAKNMKWETERKLSSVAVKPPSPNSKEYRETMQAKSVREADLAATIATIEAEIRQIDTAVEAAKQSYGAKAQALHDEKRKLEGY